MNAIGGTRVLGIDPGSRVVGFACLSSTKNRTSHPRDFSILDAGVIRVDTDLSLPERLGAIHETVYEIAQRLQPTICVVEKAFFGVNAASALKLGEARGAMVSALIRCGVQVCEITPAEVKRVIAGGGAADKEQVSRAVELLLGFKRGKLPYDVTDAMAIALTHGLSLPLQYTREKSSERIQV